MGESSQNDDLNNYDKDQSVSNEKRDKNTKKFKKYIKSTTLKQEELRIWE